jgi:small subunit ribosomal protein S15e
MLNKIQEFHIQISPTSSREQLVELMNSRARRRLRRGLKRKPLALIKKLRKAKKEAPVNEKPEIVKTHLRNMIILPEMTGSIIGVYNGKTFNQVCTFY